MNITSVSKSDVKELAEIHRTCFLQMGKQFLDFIQLNNLFEQVGSIIGLKCTDRKNKKICGFLVAQKTPDFLDILTVCVLEEYRQRGIAESLIKELFNLEDRDCFLEVAATNTAAIELYKKMKFVKIGDRKKYYNGKIDAVVMKKNAGEK